MEELARFEEIGELCGLFSVGAVNAYVLYVRLPREYALDLRRRSAG